MRRRYIQHPITFELIPAEDYVPPPREHGPLVIPDIQPYKSVVTGEVIGGRRQHREYLKRHDLIEVGNEMPKTKPMPKVPGTKEAVIQAYQQLKRKR